MLRGLEDVPTNYGFPSVAKSLVGQCYRRFVWSLRCCMWSWRRWRMDCRSGDGKAVGPVKGNERGAREKDTKGQENITGEGAEGQENITGEDGGDVGPEVSGVNEDDSDHDSGIEDDVVGFRPKDLKELC